VNHPRTVTRKTRLFSRGEKRGSSILAEPWGCKKVTIPEAGKKDRSNEKESLNNSGPLKEKRTGGRSSRFVKKEERSCN